MGNGWIYLKGEENEFMEKEKVMFSKSERRKG
jgi:hypothetical protein